MWTNGENLFRPHNLRRSSRTLSIERSYARLSGARSNKKLLLVEQFRNDAEFKLRHRRLTELETERAKLTTTMVLKERKVPRETHRFVKGDFTRPAEQV